MFYRNLALAVFFVLIAFLSLGILLGQKYPEQKTEYQKCMEAASHMRSDIDAHMWEDSVCRRAPIDPRDYK